MKLAKALLLLVLLCWTLNTTSSIHSPSSDNTAIRRVLRCALFHNPPYDRVIRGPNGTLTWLGGTKTALEWMGRKLNYSFEYVYPSEEQIRLRGVESSIDLITSGKADLIATGNAINSARLEVTDASTFFIWEDAFRMIVPVPGEEGRLLAFIKPFDSFVWLLLLLSLLFVVKSMSMISWTHLRLIQSPNKSDAARKKTSFTELLQCYFIYSVNLLTNHGDYLRLTNVTSFLICVTFWQIGASILVYSYSCIVVSSITVPTMRAMINSFEDLAASSEVVLLIRADTVVGQRILSSDAPVFKAITEKALKDPKAIGKNMTRFGELVLTGKYALPFLDTFVRYFIANEYKKSGKCKNKKSNVISLPNGLFFQHFQKGSRLTREFSLKLMELWETGQNRFWVYNELPKADVCFANVNNKQNRARQVPIKLVDLTSAFFILAIGISLSLFVFLIELLVHRRFT